MNLNILYATVSGNAEMVAKKMKNLALERNLKVSLKEMNDYTLKTFNRLDNIVIITSTYGDGDVPEMGADFWEELKNSDVKLPNMKYGLIALGDRSHEHFCGAGKQVSKKLESLDCHKVIENLECDGDTEGTFEWSLKFLDKLKDDKV